MSIESVKKALFASFASRIWSAGLNIVVVPIYLRLIGIESYGLIGLFSSLQVLVSFLDFGLGSTLIREFSRLNTSPEQKQRMSDLAKACELLYILVAVFITVILFVFIPWIVNTWIKLGQLNHIIAEKALMIATLSLAIQWPATLYTSALAGLHRQVLLATLTFGNANVRVIATLLSFHFIAATIEVFFSVQAICSVFQVVIARFLMWHQLPKASSWNVSKVQLRHIRKFAGTMTAISICSILLTQLDKIILSNTLHLKDFGLYTLTSALAGGLYVAITPIFSVIYPRFSTLVSSFSTKDILQFYHKSAQLVSLIVIPSAVTVIFFSEKIMYVWTGNQSLSYEAKWPLIFLVLGNALNGMMNVPYAMQLASGKPKIALFTNITAILFLLPSIYFLATSYGPSGGAFAWFALNVLYVFVSQYITHRKVFRGDLLKWYLVDVGIPAAFCFIVVFFFSIFLPINISRVNLGLYILCTFLVAVLSALISMPEVRANALQIIKNIPIINGIK